MPKTNIKVEEQDFMNTPQPGSLTQPISTTVLVSETDAYIHERMKSQPQTEDEIQVKFDRINEDTSEHILSLPEYFKDKKFDKYSFRWLNKKKRSIDRALDVIGWTLVSRAHSIFLDGPKHLFTANGSIERGDAILAFIPRAQAERIRLRPAEISRERVKSIPAQELRNWKDRGHEDHYKPDLKDAEQESEHSRGLVITPDDETKEE